MPVLLDQVDGRLASGTADGAYDTMGVYDAARGKGDGSRVRVLVPPGRGAQPSPGLRERKRNIRAMKEAGRREWYLSSGYSRRSLVETIIFRYKAILGHTMRSRSLAGQQVEVRLACSILNTMAGLVMPQSQKVA